MTGIDALPFATWELALATLAIFAGAAVQGAVGFGLSLVAAPILLMIDPRYVPGPLLASSILLTVLILIRERNDIELSDIAPVLVGRLPGTLIGLWLLITLDPRETNVTFGFMLLAAVAMSASRARFEPTRTSLVTAGLFSGVMSMTTSAGGPPLAIVYQSSRGSRLRATLSGHFLVGAAISLVALRGGGRLGSNEALLTMVLMPGLIIGFWVSSTLRHRIDAGYTRISVLGVAATAAIAVLWREFGASAWALSEPFR